MDKSDDKSNKWSLVTSLSILLRYHDRAYPGPQIGALCLDTMIDDFRTVMEYAHRPCLYASATALLYSRHPATSCLFWWLKLSFLISHHNLLYQ